MLTIEDGGVLGSDLANVEAYYRKGVRLVTLTWNHPNAIGFPNSRDPEIMSQGLTAFGREVVREMERLGMVVDISHVWAMGIAVLAGIICGPLFGMIF